MRLCECAISQVKYESVNRFDLTREQKLVLFEDLMEGIKTSNESVDEFVKENATPFPTPGERYYPITVNFIFVYDQIEIYYSDKPLQYVDTKNEACIYTDGKSTYRFSESHTHRMTSPQTFHFSNIDDLNDLRSLIMLKWGDCKFKETKI